MRQTVNPRLRAVVITSDILTSNLSPAEKLCVAILAMHGEVAFPGIKRVAGLMGCSYDAASRALKALKEKKWLVINPRRRSDGSKTTNQYVITLPANCGEGSPQSAGGIPANGGIINSEGNVNLSLSSGDDNESAPDFVAPVSSQMIPARAKIASPVTRLLADYRGAVRSITHREPVIFYARDGRLFKRLLEIFTEDEVVRVARVYINECQSGDRPITVMGLFAAAERIAQRLKLHGNKGGQK